MELLTAQERDELGLITLNELKNKGNKLNREEGKIIFASNGNIVGIYELIVDDLYAKQVEFVKSK